MKKLFALFLTIIVIVSSFTITVFADSFGTEKTIDLRWNSAFHCVAPTDTTFYYYYVLSGSSGAFNWIGNDYVLIWSKEVLIIENNTISMNAPFYYVSSSTLDRLISFLTTEQVSATVYQASSDFSVPQSGSIRVHYSNQRYTVDGVVHPAHWISAVSGDYSYALKSFFDTIYRGLKNTKIRVFGTELSAYVIVAGPFLISFTISVLQKILGVGNAAAVHSVSAGRNIKNKIQKNKENKERNRQEK